MTKAHRSALPALLLVSVVVVAAVQAACSPPRVDVAAADVPKIKTLTELMNAQATIADPQLKKKGATSYSDADYAAFAEVSSRIEATSTKAKEFSRGPEFDKLTDRLRETAVALGKAAAAKDAKTASDSLAAMGATCTECHHKFH